MQSKKVCNKNNNEATLILTSSCLSANLEFMPMISDVVRSMEQRRKHEVERIQAARAEIEKLSPAFNRYVDLRAEIKEAEDRYKRISAVLYSEAEPRDSVLEDISETLNSLRSKLVLWKAIEEYLSHVSEAMIEDIQTFLVGVGINSVSRQAIESALRTHTKIFAVRKKGRDKFVSLRN